MDGCVVDPAAMAVMPNRRQRREFTIIAGQQHRCVRFPAGQRNVAAGIVPGACRAASFQSTIPSAMSKSFSSSTIRPGKDVSRAHSTLPEFMMPAGSDTP